MDIRYLAGVVDGEGCIDLRSGRYPSLRLWIANTYRPLLLRIQEQFGGSVEENKSFPYESRKSKKHVYQWEMSGRKARDLLRMLFPYLVVKADQAAVALKVETLTKTRWEYPGGRLSQADLDQRAALREELRLLKRG